MEASALPEVASRLDVRAVDDDADAADVFEVDVDVADDRGPAVRQDVEAPPEVLLEDDDVFWRGLGSLVVPGACFPCR